MHVKIPKEKNCSFMTVGSRDRRERQREKKREGHVLEAERYAETNIWLYF